MLYSKADGPLSTAKLRLDMQKAMQANAAVFRSVFILVAAWAMQPDGFSTLSTEETLAEGVQKVSQIYRDFDKVGVKDRSMIWNS